jgi:hypothetical protein
MEKSSRQTLRCASDRSALPAFLQTVSRHRQARRVMTTRAFRSKGTAFIATQFAVSERTLNPAPAEHWESGQKRGNLKYVAS